jgi:chaperone required for assembly of F1-ATPase
MSRFYRTSTAQAVDDGYAVLLDNRPVKTPHSRSPLVVPTRELAEAAAAEWDSQGDTVEPATMPVTAIASTALDLDAQRDELVAAIARHGETDPVCYWVTEPTQLRTWQQTYWQPLLDWLALNYDARLNVTTGLLPISQPPDATKALSDAVAARNRFQLAALSSAVAATSSLVIALALMDRRLNADSAFTAAELEASYQIEQWGEDTESATRRTRTYTDLQAAERVSRALTGEPIT